MLIFYKTNCGLIYSKIILFPILFLYFREFLVRLFLILFFSLHYRLTSACYDDASRFMRIITRSATRSYIIPEDLIPLVQDIVNTHPGLTFLKQAPEFHSRYVHTVSRSFTYLVGFYMRTEREKRKSRCNKG